MTTIKIIELEDVYTSLEDEFPFVLSVQSRIRLRLRSNVCYQLTPVVLV
jgi:hypothetical protein